MKIQCFPGSAATWRVAVLAGVASAFSLSSTFAATTDIQLWYSLNPHNAQVFQRLVKQFNSDQSQVKVTAKAYDTPQAVEAALSKSLAEKKSPNLVQLDDNRAPDEIAKRRYILPMYTLLAKYPIKDAKWFLPESNTFARDSKGRLLAFPYMVDVPVMYYNIGAFKKVGIEPAIPDRSWKGLQPQLIKLANGGWRKCPLATDQSVSVNLENLAAVNNQLYTSDDNGLKAKGTPGFTFDVMYVRHLSMMISWAKAEILVKPQANLPSTQLFSKGECAVLMSSSSNLGWFSDARSLSFGVASLPYYPEVTTKPGNPFVSGAALWAIDGHPQADNKAVSEFLGWLAQPANAAKWYQNTGYLPLTQQAFASTDSAYYKNLGAWRAQVAAYATQPSHTARGFRVENYLKIKAMFQSTLDRALNGQQPAVTALKSASTEAGKIMKER